MQQELYCTAHQDGLAKRLLSVLAVFLQEVAQLSDLASTLEQLTYDAGRVADSLVAQQLTGVRREQGMGLGAGGWARASRVWRFPDMQPMQLFCWHALMVLRVLLPYLSHWHACECCPPPNKHLQHSLSLCIFLLLQVSPLPPT